MLNYLRLKFLNVCVWIASKLTQTAQALFSVTLGLALQWDIKDEKPPAVVAEPVPEPVEPPERLSTRHRRLRREKAAAEALTAVEEVPETVKVVEEVAPPLAKDRQALAPEVNPFSAGGVEGTIPMCMDPLPNFIVFEAMFNKKYGHNGRCPLTVMNTAHAYSALELYALLSRIEADGEKAGPVYNALYGTVYSVIIHQHGKKLEPKELN